MVKTSGTLPENFEIALTVIHDATIAGTNTLYKYQLRQVGLSGLANRPSRIVGYCLGSLHYRNLTVERARPA